jgi:hypothetical protein
MVSWAAERGDRLVYPKREQVSRARGHLDARDERERVTAAAVHLAGEQRASDVVVVRDRDEIEVR